MSFVLLAVLAGFVLAAVGAYAVARIELKGGGAPRIGWRFGLSAVQVYLSTFTVVQVAADVVLSSAPLEEPAVDAAKLLVRVTLAAIVLWIPLALVNLGVAAFVFRRGDRDALAVPLFAAATYAVALMAVLQSGWLAGPL
ncbi:MAG: hypothetical protein AAFZ65_08175 [Planctomycetota bacterium]